MTLTELSIKKPILVIVFFLVTSLFGLISYLQLQYELLPNIAAPFTTVFTLYPGASPKEVENSVTKLIESSVGSVSKIKRISATSSEGISTVMIEFLQDADGDKANDEVQRAISQVLSELPAGAKTPSVVKFSINDLPVMRIGVTAKVPDQELFEMVKSQIRPRISQLRSVGRVTTLGGNEREIKVFLDQEKLLRYQLSTIQVLEALRKANLDIPIGRINDTDAQFGIRMTGKADSFEHISGQFIAYTPEGGQIRLRDVGRVEAGLKESTVITRLDRSPSLGLVITKQTGSNAVEVTALVRAEMARMEEEYKSVGLRFSIAQDTSEFTLAAANAVFKDLIIAIFLVAAVMLVFLHSLRNALIVMVAIPSSLVFAFILMKLMGFSLNLMTLLAMSLVIGILVDDSIVVLENIYRHLEMGKDRFRASLEGRNEIGFSALSITLVDVVVFLPLALVPGLVGSLVREFALVVVVSTLASLLVCFTLTPMMASRFARLEHPTAANLYGRLILWIESLIDRIVGLYQPVLSWSLRHRFGTVMISLLLLVGAIALVPMGMIGAEFAPSGDKGELSLSLTLPPGTHIDSTQAAVARLEARISQMPEIKRIFTTVGYSTDINGDVYAPNTAQFNIQAVPATERSQTTRQLSRHIRRMALEVPGAKAIVAPVGLLGAENAPILISVIGSHRDSVRQAADLLLNTLKQTPGAFNPRLAAEQGKPEVEIVLNRPNISRLGLDIEQVGLTLRTAINGHDDLKLREGNVETPIRIQLEKDDRLQIEQLNRMTFTNAAGQTVFLRQLADLRLVTGPSVLERRNRNPSLTVVSQVVGRGVSDVGTDLQQAMAKVRLPQGVRISYEGDLELADDSFGKLGLALLTSIILVYLIMVALYNDWVYPFVVLFSIPVALVGALWALALTAKTINVFSIFGLIMLVGLVAKNAILLVDRANDLRSQGRNVLYALLDAGQTRLRPILMTTIAMVIGMLPLALATGPGGEINSSLAWVLIGGLSSSMFLTLVLVPAVYLQITRWIEGRRPKAVPAAVAATVLLVLMAAPVQAQTRTLSIREAEAQVLTDNLDLRASRLEVDKSVSQVREARSGLLPQVAASANYQHFVKPQVFFLPGNLFDPTADPGFTAIPASAKNVYNANVEANLPLLNLETPQLIAMSRLQGQQALHADQRLRQQKVSQVRRTGYSILLAQAACRLAQASAQRQTQNLEDARRRLAQGLLSEADTLQPYLQVEYARTSLFKAQNSLQIAKTQFKVLLNWDESDDFALSDSLTIGQEDLLLFDEREDADRLEQHPDLLRLRTTKDLSERQRRLEQARLMPRLTGVWQYASLTQADNLRFGNYFWTNVHFVGLQLNIPLFNGFRQTARIQQARIQSQQADVQWQSAKRAYSLEASTFRQQMREYRRQVEDQQKNIAAAERLYQSVRQRWQNGLLRWSDLQDAELSLQQSKVNHLQMVHDYLQARENLLFALGRTND